MNKRVRQLLFSVIFLLIGFQGCKRNTSLSETDFKDMYSSNTEVPQPYFKVFHPEPNKTEVFFMFENRGLTYSPSVSGQRTMSRVRIAWQLYSGYTSREILDSSSFVMIDTIATSGLKQLLGSFKLNLNDGANYILKITTTDLNNSQKTISFVQINKTDKTNRQYFKVTLKETGSILFRNYFYPNEKLIIEYAPDKSLTQLQGKHFEVVFPVASPPFSLSKPKPFDFDNHTKFDFVLSSGKGEFSSDKRGIYHFGIDEKNRYTGLTLFQYTPEFPEVNTPQEMLSPLRFITSKKEFMKLKYKKDIKKAVDEFWLTTAPDKEKAKRLIKGYYNRVENANYFFSSYKEGWKTDRGVIYTVFGPPSVVYRSMEGESWVYGEESNYKSLTFNFSKVNNPFTNNDYVLQRNTLYKNPWYRAVDAWRQGKVASLEY